MPAVRQQFIRDTRLAYNMKRVISILGIEKTMKANLLASGDHAPDELMKLMASKCGSLSGPPSFLIRRPVWASAI